MSYIVFVQVDALELGHVFDHFGDFANVPKLVDRQVKVLGLFPDRNFRDGREFPVRAVVLEQSLSRRILEVSAFAIGLFGTSTRLCIAAFGVDLVSLAMIPSEPDTDSPPGSHSASAFLGARVPIRPLRPTGFFLRAGVANSGCLSRRLALFLVALYCYHAHIHIVAFFVRVLQDANVQLAPPAEKHWLVLVQNLLVHIDAVRACFVVPPSIYRPLYVNLSAFGTFHLQRRRFVEG